MIKSLLIENFRAFQKLELSSLKRLNVVVGDNGSGKTALLEALFLASAANPQVNLTLRQWRGLENAGATTSIDVYESLWRNLFFRFEPDAVIRIEMRGSQNDSRSLSVHFDSSGTITLPLSDVTNGRPQATYLPIIFHWTVPGAPDSVLTMRSTLSGLQMEGLTRESNMRAAFIPAHAQTSNQYTAQLFSNLSKQNQEGEFVAALRKQFPGIERVSTEIDGGASALFVSTPWMRRKIPLALYSNAASNLASILLNIAGSPRGLVCVDEIENGFHYSRHEAVWEQVFAFADSFQTQVFASTHSAENLRAIVPAIKKSPNDVALIQVHQKDGVSHATVVSGADALAAISHGIEVRT